MRLSLYLSVALLVFSFPVSSQTADDELIVDIQQLYIGILGRAADQAGLDYWLGEINTGKLTLENTRTAFTQQVEYSSLYGSLNNTELVTLIYQNFLERDPDDDGLLYWVGELDAGKITPDHMVNAIINAVEDPDTSSGRTLIDNTVLMNKVTVAKYFTDASSSKEVDDDFISAARNSVADVNDNSSSVDTATAAVDTEVASLTEESNRQWIVNSVGTRSKTIFETNSNQGVLVNVRSVSDSTVNNTTYTNVETTGIPDYAVQLSQDEIAALNQRPKAATDFLSGSTTATAGETITFGQDIGYKSNNQNCTADAGYGYWPPGPVCPTNQNKSGYFPQQPVAAATECETGLGAIGFAINGVSIYNWGDGQSYNNEGVWQTLAPFAEVYDVDICGGHAANGDYHHHFYTECWGEVAKEDGQGHSSVLGYAADGYAVHGPWFQTSVLTKSCWVTRDYSADSATGGGCDNGDRSCTLNDVYDLSQGTTPVNNSPSLTDTYSSLSSNTFIASSGFFKEDYYFDSSCSASGGANLDQSNGHDHDNLGYHYHVTVSSSDNKTPVYPFIIGPKFKGELADNAVSNCKGSGTGVPPGGPRPAGGR